MFFASSAQVHARKPLASTNNVKPAKSEIVKHTDLHINQNCVGGFGSRLIRLHEAVAGLVIFTKSGLSL